MNPSLPKHSQLESELERQLEINRLFTEHSLDSMLLLDSQGRITDANPAAERTFGWTAQELRGRPLNQLLQGLRDRAETEFEAWAGEDGTTHEDVIFHRDGHAVPVLCSSSLLQVDGEKAGALVVLTDVSDTKQAEADLRLLERAVESVGNGIVICDATRPDLPVSYVNPAFERITGYEKPEVVGRSCKFLQGSETEQPDLSELRSALAEARRTTVTLRNFRKDGTLFWNELSVSPVRDDRGELRHFIGVVNDITERVEILEELHRSKQVLEVGVQERTAELERANADLEGFTYSVSHDLRAPLRAIVGFSRLLIEDHGDQLDPEIRSHLERITVAAKRMASIIDDLLTFSRLGRKEINKGPVDLTQIAEAIGADLVRRHPDRNTLIAVDHGMMVQGDPTLLRLALENLLENAYKFTSKSERGFIEVRRVDSRTFVVRDNGVGFDPTYADKLFRPFERLHSDRDFPGTGIGLANVRRIIERHGGRVWAYGRPDQGASFYFTIG